MPAKTVQDLIAFNNSVPSEMKVKVCLQQRTPTILEAYFVYEETQEKIYQTNKLRAKYYEIDFSQQKIEKASQAGLPRLEEPSHKPMFPWGKVSCKRNLKKELYKCNNAWFIGVSEVAKGYGPMLYDCLIAKLGENGFGLTADRNLVSAPAARVWSEYLTSRPDVRKEKLDLDNSTPETDDDCYATHGQEPDWNTWIEDPKKTDYTEEEHTKELEKRKVMRSAVNFAYFDNGITTVNELQQAGLLIDKVDKINESYFIKNLYESFLRDLKL